MYRLPLLLLAILSLLFAIWAGLLRMGWAWPPVQPALGAAHGPLMVSAFLGTVISLERVVALNVQPAGGRPNAIDRRWAYVVPLLSALGGVVLITGLSWVWGGRLLVLAGAGLVVLFAMIVRQHATIYTWTMAAGSVAWLAGNLLLASGRPLPIVSPWWVAFLVLTIAGERLELSRVLRLTRGVVALFAAGAVLLIGGVIGTLLFYDAAVRLAGLGLIVLAAWLLFFDVARRNLRHSGLTRFIAWCLFSGYFWLGIGGALWVIYGGVPAGPIYDAILHSVFLGFVFAMIFGHAPLIFPSVLGRPMAYLPAFYAPLIVLHLSLALRVAGDLLNVLPLRQWGGLLNGVTLLLFLGVTATALVRGSRRPANRT